MFSMMNGALRAHLSRFVGKSMVGFSRINTGRVKHTVALNGDQLLKMFSFVADNTSKKVSRVQRDTEIRYEDGVPHVSGPVAERPLPQTIFHATWRRDLNKLELQDGNTRVLDALRHVEKPFFEQVTLEVYEVDTQLDAELIYRCFDSREAAKQGKHDVQSLFRAADVLPVLLSLRMRRAVSLVTPLKLLTKKQTFKAMTPGDVGSYLPTLKYTDALLFQLEPVELSVPAREFSAVFGGGELAGIMLFHSENHLNPAATPFLSMIQQHVVDTLIYAIQHNPYTTPFSQFYQGYLTATSLLGRSGSKVVPERAKHFQAALQAYLVDMMAKGAAAMAVAAKAPRARSKK